MFCENYYPEGHQIAETAATVAARLEGLVREKNRSPNKLIVMLGENHVQMAHQFFAVKFIEAMNKQQKVTHFFDEVDIRYQSRIDDSKPGARFKTIVKQQVLKWGADWAFMTVPAMAVSQKIACHFVGANRERSGGDHWISDPVSRKQFKAYENSPYMRDIMDRYDQAFKVKYPKANETLGLVQHDLILHDRIAMKMAATPGIGITRNGQRHLIDNVRSDRPTLTEMLLATGHDIAGIMLHSPKQKSRSSFDGAQRKMVKRLIPNMSAHYLAHIDVTLPDMNVKINEQAIEWARLERSQGGPNFSFLYKMFMK